MKTVILKNGAEEAEICVKAHMMNLSILLEEHPTAFYGLVMKCRDRNYFWWNDAIIQQLKDLGLLQGLGDTVHDSTKNVVLSAVTGDGLDMVLGSPTAL